MNTLERHFLSRSYDSKKKIEELLEQRYSHTGGQKPYLIFGERTKEETPTETRLTDRVLTSKRKRHTRTQLKSYISSTISRQRRLCRHISQDPTIPVEKAIREWNIPTFEEFVPMHNLWQQYMQDLLFPNGQIHGANMVLPRLSSADYNGCLVTVKRSRNTTLVGMRGIVICDTQHSFVMCCPRGTDSKEWTENGGALSVSEKVGGLKVVQKKGSYFSFEVLLPGGEECMEYVLVGSRMEFRAVDRSGRKFKSHSVDDL